MITMSAFPTSTCELPARQASSYDLTLWKHTKGFDLFSLKSAKHLINV